MKQQERMRIARLLEQDKEEINEESRAAAIAEFTRVASEYFEPTGALSLSIERERNGFAVRVQFHALRVKNFTSFRGKSANED